MHILITCLSKSWGGMEMFTISSLYLLLQNGYKVTAACIENSPIHRELKAHGISVELFKPARLSFSNLLKFAKLFTQNKFDLIHSHYSKDLWQIIPALKLTSSELPIVLTKHLGSGVSKKDYLHRKLYDRLDHAIAISNVIKDNLLESTTLTDEKISLISNYIDLNRYKKSQLVNLRLRKEFSIDRETYMLGVVARITPGKGHEEVIEAVNKLKNENLNFKVMVVGTSSADEKKYEEDLKNQIKNFGIEKYFIFSGFRSDVPDLLAMFDLFLFPSRAEAFGLALLEAMATGLPNIVCYSDGVKDIAVKGETSLTFNRMDSDMLARQIKIALTDENLRDKLGKNSLARAQFFSEGIFQKKITALYEFLVSKKTTKVNSYIPV